MQKKIIGFTIEIDGKEQINQTTTILGLLNTQLILLDTTLKEVNKQSNETFKDLSKSLNNTSSSASKLGDVVKGSISSFEKNSEAVRGLGNGYFEVKEQIQQIAKIDKQRIKQLNQLTSLTKEQEKELNSLLVAQQQQKIIQRERNSIAKQTAIINQEEGDTIKSLRAQLSLTSLQWAKLTVAEQDNSKEGKRLTAQKTRLTEQLKAIEAATGDNRRNVGNYVKELVSANRVTSLLAKSSRTLRKDLTKVALRLSVGRSIAEGFANGVRSASQGLQQLVEDGDGTNEVFNELESSGDKLQATLVNVGTEFLGAFGSGIAKIIDNVSFIISVVSDSLIEASESTGFFGSVLRGVGEILTNFPAIFGGIVEASREFIANTGRAFTSFSINAQLAYENFLVFSKGIAGFDTSEAEKNIQQLTKELEKNSEGARTLGQAYTDGYNATLKAQEEFNKESEKEVEVQNKRAAAVKRREAARKEAARAEKKRIEDEKRAIEQLNKDRQELLNTLRQEAAARVEIAKDLQAQLVDIRIEAIEDETQRLEEAEKVRFEREKAAREASFKALQDQAASQEAEALRLFGKSSKELKALKEQNDKDLLELSKINDKIGKAQEQAYQDNLLAIRKSAANEARTTQAEIDEQALQDVLEFQAKQLEAEKEAEAERLAVKKEAVNAAISIFNTGFDLIEKLSSIGAEAEQERFNQAIEARKKNLEALNEDLQGATGLQKQFLEQQVKQEKEALEQEEKNREAAERKRVKQAQALALVQVAINGAIAVTRAFSDLGPIAGAVAAVGVGAAIIAQIAEISSQKFEKGGELKGKSHAQGGIPFTINGQAGFEAEGGEGLINKKSMQNPYLRAIASFANEAGGGVAFSNTKSLNKFQNGGLIGPSSPAPSVPSSADAFLRAIDTKTDAINSRIDRVQVALDVNNLQDFEGNEAKLQALTTLD